MSCPEGILQRSALQGRRKKCVGKKCLREEESEVVLKKAVV